MSNVIRYITIAIESPTEEDVLMDALNAYKHSLNNLGSTILIRHLDSVIEKVQASIDGEEP